MESKKKKKNLEVANLVIDLGKGEHSPVCFASPWVDTSLICLFITYYYAIGPTFI